MQSPACPEFEYQHVSNYQSVLADRTLQTTRRLVAKPLNDILPLLKDTRPVHARYFEGLTPSEYPHYAGNYRGANLPCLERYVVSIRDDPRVGRPPHAVHVLMSEFAAEVQDTVSELDFLHRTSDTVLSKPQKLARTVQLLAALFVYFLEIHPYANGNGHMARFLMISALWRHGYVLSKWKIDPRPPDPPYSEAIKLYRSGIRQPLEHFIMSCL